MKAIRDYNQLANKALEPVNTEQSGCAQDRQAVQRVIPKFLVRRKILKRSQQGLNFSRGILLTQRLLQGFK